ARARSGGAQVARRNRSFIPDEEPPCPDPSNGRAGPCRRDTVAKGTQRCMLPAVPEVSDCMNAPGQPSHSRKPRVESEFPSNRRRARRVEISAAHFLSAVTSEDCHLRATLLVQVMIPQVSPLPPYEAANRARMLNGTSMVSFTLWSVGSANVSPQT